MGTYDNAAGHPLHDKSFEEERLCMECGRLADDCVCPVCPGCGEQGNTLCFGKEGHLPAHAELVIRSLHDLCDWVGTDMPDGLNRQIYKNTQCGASISLALPGGDWLHNGDLRWRDLSIDTPIEGFTIQTIVEGSEATWHGVDSRLFKVPISVWEVEAWMEYMEDEAARLFCAANKGGLAHADAREAYEELCDHIGHEIVVAYYGDREAPVNVAVECETCGLVLLDYNRPEDP